MNAGFKIFFAFLISTKTFAAPLCVDTSAILEKGHDLRRQGQYLLAAQQFSLVETLGCESELKNIGSFYYALSLYRLDEKQIAEETLMRLSSANPTSDRARKARLLMAWNEPQFISRLDVQDQDRLARFQAEVTRIQRNERLQSPALAGTLSALLPGAGQVYNHHYSAAVLSFILNSLFLASTIELNDKNLHAPALAAGVLFSITYTGNILSAIEGSRQINRAYQAPRVDEAQKILLPDLEH